MFLINLFSSFHTGYTGSDQLLIRESKGFIFYNKVLEVNHKNICSFASGWFKWRSATQLYVLEDSYFFMAVSVIPLSMLQECALTPPHRRSGAACHRQRLNNIYQPVLTFTVAKKIVKLFLSTDAFKQHMERLCCASLYPHRSIY